MSKARNPIRPNVSAKNAKGLAPVVFKSRRSFLCDLFVHGKTQVTIFGLLPGREALHLRDLQWLAESTRDGLSCQMAQEFCMLWVRRNYHRISMHSPGTCFTHLCLTQTRHTVRGRLSPYPNE